MTKRLPTILLMTMFSLGAISPAGRAQGDPYSNATLKGISALFVVVEELPDGAKKLGLTKEAIQTDVELKLRLAGMRVVTQDEGYKLPGSPQLYVEVNTDGVQAASIAVTLKQDAILVRTGEPANWVATWQTNGLATSPTASFIRNAVKDQVDQFLNAWLSVNPKK